MKFLGWSVAALLSAVVLLGAAKSADDSSTAKLEEIKTIVAESLRLQRLDMHRRLFPAHKLGPKCDLDEGCAAKDGFVRAHARAWAHPWAEDCAAGGICKAKEEAYQKKSEGEGK